MIEPVPPPRILVVEDEKDAATLLKGLLVDGLAATIEVAADCAAARKAASSRDFDLITLDQQLPDGDGIELLEEFQAAGAHPPVIMVTGRGSEKMAARCYRAGAAGYVIKDARLNFSLLDAVSRVLELSRAEKELRESETRYRSLFENMMEGFAYCRMVYDDEGHAVDWVYLDTNKAFGPLTGLKDVVGKKVSEVIPGIRETNPELFEVYGRVASSGEPEQVEARLERLSIDLSIKVYSPQRQHFVAVFENITERKQAESDLSASAERFQQMFDSMSSCVAVYQAMDDGDDFTFVDFNKAAERVEEISRDELLGRSVTEVFPGVEDFGILEVFRRVWTSGEPESFPAGKYEDGRVSGWKENYIYKLPTGEIVAVYDDVTQQRQAEESLRENESRFRFLAENMNDLVFTADLVMNPTYVSPSIKRVLGFTVEERLRQRPEEMVTPESFKVAADRMVDELLHDTERDPGRTDVVELDYYHADGSTMCLETSISFIRDENQVPIGIFGLSRDVTERKRIEAALQYSEELFREMSEVAVDAIVVLDSAGRVKYWNPAAERTFGHRAEDMLGADLALVLSHPEDREKYGKIVDEFRETGAAPMLGQTFGTSAVSKSGAVIPVEVSSAAFMAGGEWNAVVNIRDITERREAEELVKQHAEELRNLVDVAAHELRHPATIFKGYSGMLLHHGGDLDDEVVRDAILAIDGAADRLAALINKLLDTSNIESGKMELNISRADPWKTVLRAVEETRGRGGDIDFLVKRDSEAWTVEMDQEKIKDVLVILLDNVIKHAPGTGEVEIGCVPAGGETVFRVSDRGPGISERDRERIFERFYQVGELMHHSTPGIGLGLYIARKYVEAHRGWITVEERAGGGSMFCFGIPNSLGGWPHTP